MVTIDKLDWFTTYLMNQGFWVGGSKYVSNSSKDIYATKTIRYFLGKNKKFLVVPIFEFNQKKISHFDYKNFVNEATVDYPFSYEFVLLIWPNLEIDKKFAVVYDGLYFDHLDSTRALDFFYQFDQSLVDKPDYLKPLNKGPTDYFHQWARSFMGGFQNDIDAYVVKNSKTYMFELKRPNESLSTWKPYKNDRWNYTTFQHFCDFNKYELINIAYSKNVYWLIKIFKNVKFENNRLNYDHKNLKLNISDKLIDLIGKLDFYNTSSRR